MKGYGASLPFRIANALLLGGIVFVCLLPFVNIVAISFSRPGAVIRGEVNLWPVGFFLKSYAKVFEMPEFFSGYANTIFYAAAGTLVSMALTILCAYPLSKRSLMGRGFFMGIVVFSMLFSAGMIPFYLVVKAVGLLNTRWAVILPFAVNTWNMVVMRTFFQGVPEELEEAGMMDGLNPFQSLLLIVLPLSQAILATIGLFYAVGYWNSWFWQMVLIDTADKHPVSLFLRKVVMGAGMTSDDLEHTAARVEDTINAESLKAASVILVVTPIILVYPFVQKYFVKGVMVGSLKG